MHLTSFRCLILDAAANAQALAVSRVSEGHLFAPRGCELVRLVTATLYDLVVRPRQPPVTSSSPPEGRWKMQNGCPVITKPRSSSPRWTVARRRRCSPGCVCSFLLQNACQRSAHVFICTCTSCHRCRACRRIPPTHTHTHTLYAHDAVGMHLYNIVVHLQ